MGTAVLRRPTEAADANLTVDAAEATDATESDPTPPPGWAPRRVLGGLVRVLALAIPVTASAATGIALASALPARSGPVGTVLWYGVIFVASMIALVLVDRAARRLLPLSVLPRLSLIFRAGPRAERPRCRGAPAPGGRCRPAAPGCVPARHREALGGRRRSRCAPTHRWRPRRPPPKAAPERSPGPYS